ncbi:hypothetical protein Y032_0041g433 [Ancylostoma ceylanicum]|uniref:Uncharacterized protein n=1 Tax=Ancylostoma ceylanicum TaxID=53326 RepID=A0A016UH65_9BILA|nr:hypothetical protein Y032_0041g433 [Ancylostoma ceylanicum]
MRRAQRMMESNLRTTETMSCRQLDYLLNWPFSPFTRTNKGSSENELPAACTPPTSQRLQGFHTMYSLAGDT